MELNKKNVKKILLIITFTAILFAAVQHLDGLSSAVGTFFKVFAPINIGIISAYIMNNLMSFFENSIFKLMKNSKKPIVRRLLRPLSLGLTILIVLSVFVIIAVIIIPDLKDTVVTLSSKLPGYFNDLKIWGIGMLERYHIDSEWLEDFTINWSVIGNAVSNFFSKGNGLSVMGTVSSVASAVTGGAANLVFGIVIAIYLLAQKERICSFIKRVIMTFTPKKVYKKGFRILGISNDIFTSFITGQFTEALILGSLSFIGMLIFRLPHAGIISVMICITAVVPIIGALVGEGFGALLIFTESPIKALIFLIFILCLQQVEGTLIYPKVVGKSVGLPGVLVFGAVIIGGNLLGIFGALIGVPVCAIIYTLIKQAIAQRSSEKKEPASLE